MLEELRSQVPPGVLALLRDSRAGAEESGRASQGTRSIASLDMLRAACEADEVSELKGFGAKTEEKILAGIDFAAHADERMYWAEADEIVQELLAHMRKCKGVRQIEVAGSYRRGKETIGDLDLLVDAKTPTR